MCARRARDDEVERWRNHGWVLVDGLVGVDEIDGVGADLHQVFPTAQQYHSDPAQETVRRLGSPRPHPDSFPWPDAGPGFRDDQHRWQGLFPFPGSGALNRLVVHQALVDFAERALGTSDLRLYQAGVSAKYTGITNYEQPMHTDRNHSWLPAVSEPPWWHVEGFLYLSDVCEPTAPTHLVSVRDSGRRQTTVPLVMPEGDPELYAAERAATGVRGSFLAYRPDVFHRAVDLVEPGGARFLLNVSFKVAGQDWIGYNALQSAFDLSGLDQVRRGRQPPGAGAVRFSPPGHPIWSTRLVEETQELYPKLDLSPWRSVLSG